MPTINQLVRKPAREQASKPKHPALQRLPAEKGVCLQVKIMTPKKPNSVCERWPGVRLSNGVEVTAYIPGEGHNHRNTRSCWSAGVASGLARRPLPHRPRRPRLSRALIRPQASPIQIRRQARR